MNPITERIRDLLAEGDAPCRWEEREIARRLWSALRAFALPFAGPHGFDAVSIPLRVQED